MLLMAMPQSWNNDAYSTALNKTFLSRVLCLAVISILAGSHLFGSMRIHDEDTSKTTSFSSASMVVADEKSIKLSIYDIDQS